MSDTPMKLVVDVARGTQEYIPLTAEEIQQRELDAIAAATAAQEKADAEAAREALKTSAKAKLVAGTPLTDEEAAAITL